MNVAGLAHLVGLTNTKPVKEGPQKRQLPEEFDKSKLEDKKIFLSWEAVSRPPRKDMSDRITRSSTIIGIVLALILVILKEFFLILVIVSLIFVGHVLAKVPPEKLRYSLSNHGLMIGEEQYYWHQFYRFFFMENAGLQVLAIDSLSGSPPRIFMTINVVDKEKIKEFLSNYLDYIEEEPKTMIDRSYESVLNKFNI